MIRQIVIILIFNCVFVTSNDLILKRPKDKFLIFAEMIEEIVENCDDQLDVILIYENSSDINKYFRSAKLTKSKIIISNFTQEITNSTIRQKVDAFFMAINSPVEYISVMKYLHHSKYWNVLSKFYIFYTEEVNRNIERLMWVHGWQSFHVLNLYCIRLYQSNLVIFTYNPYASYAPFPWQRTNSTNRKLIFYQRPYIKEQLCHGLNFDRTKYLNGTEVQYAGFFNHMRTPELAKWMETNNIKLNESIFAMSSDQGIGVYHPEPLVPFLSHFLNINLKGLYFSFAIITANHIQYLKQLKPPLLLYYCYDKVEGYVDSFPIIYLRSTILSHNQGYRTLFEQMYYLLGNWIIIFTCCICSLTFFVTWYNSKKDRLMFACFEIIRLLINASIETAINSLPLKLYFSAVFLYFLIIQSVLQSKLANFLTDPVPRPSANTLDDLESPVYSTIFGGDELFMIDDYKNFSHKINYVRNSTEKIQKFINDKSAALFGELHELKQIVLYNNTVNLYLAKQSIFDTPYCYTLYEDEPLKDRLNKALLTLWEIGMSHYFMTKGFSVFQMFYDKRIALIEAQHIHQPINLNSIICLIIFLGTGIFIATICFFIELIVGRKEKNEN